MRRTSSVANYQKQESWVAYPRLAEGEPGLVPASFGLSFDLSSNYISQNERVESSQEYFGCISCCAYSNLDFIVLK